MEDTSLDEFLDGEGSSDATGDRERDEQVGEKTGHTHEEPGSDSHDETQIDPAAVESADSTYQWTPTGVTCDNCERERPRRWTGESGFVCDSCKDW